jgi:excinuclease ABC subunit A
VDHGNTVVVIEHNLDVLKTADFLIDLGPEGGEKGGYVIAEGSPEEIAANPGSSTGTFLKETLQKHRKKAGPASKSNGTARSRRKVAVG